MRHAGALGGVGVKHRAEGPVISVAGTGRGIGRVMAPACGAVGTDED